MKGSNIKGGSIRSLRSLSEVEVSGVKVNTTGKLTSFFAALIVFSFLQSPVRSQDLEPGWKHWMFLNIDIPVTKKFSLSAEQQFSMNPGPYRLNMFTHSSNQGFAITKNFELLAGYNVAIFPNGNEGRLAFHRIQTGFEARQEIFGISCKHKVRVQYFIPTVRKYTARVVYQFRVNWKNKFLPMKGTPYMSHNLYYYIGGKPLLYYDEEGAVMAFQSPTDLHRYRMTLGCNFKPAKNVNVSLFYNCQWEFNTNLFPNRGLNVTRPGEPGALLPFNNYWNYGAYVNLTLPTPGKKKKKKGDS